MFVEMTENIGTAVGSYRRGIVYDVVPEFANDWIRGGFARKTDKTPTEIGHLLAKLDEFAGKPCLFLPFCGEFGHLLMSHIRIVHFHRASEKIVCCKRGERVLFPSATAFVTEWEDPITDEARIATIRDTKLVWPELEAAYPLHFPVAAGNLTPTQEVFPIRAEARIPFRPKCRGLRADVVFGVRHRAFCPERNWKHWSLATALNSAGFTYATIGDRSTSTDIAGQVCHSGDFDTDAAIELLQNCRLYVGTDSGTSHLASTVGTRMCVFREEASGSRDLFPRMEAVNPGRIDIVPSGWTKPEAVAARMIAMLGGAAA